MTGSKLIRWIVVVIVAQLAGAIQLLAANDGLAARVIVLANSRQPESVKLAEFYAEKRGIPRVNVVALPLPEDETITWRDFIDQLYRPLQDELFRRGWLEGSGNNNRKDALGRTQYKLTGHHISYLVTCRGVPLRIKSDVTLLDEATGRRVGRRLYKNEAAVDSELGMLAQSGYEITGAIPNPFFNHEQLSVREAGSVVKVSRLDGPSFESARDLVTSALEGERTGLLGRYYADLKGPHPDGDKWLQGTVGQLETMGFDGDAEQTSAMFSPAARFDAPAFYFGWHASDVTGPFTIEGFKFPPGAIAFHVHSFSARTLHSETQGWCGPLVARGVAATLGNVFEPFLELTHRPDLFLFALSQGKNFGDAACYALPVMSWQAVAIGDPLYRPFKVSLEQQERQAGELPATLAPYVLMRRANILLHQQKAGDAWNLLRAGLQEHPSVVLAVACARLAIGANSGPAAVEALRSIESLHDYRAEEWAVAREMAVMLSTHGAGPAALQVYANLVKTKAPIPAAHQALLAEAQALAEATGDKAMAAEFARLRSGGATQATAPK